MVIFRRHHLWKIPNIFFRVCFLSLVSFDFLASQCVVSYRIVGRVCQVLHVRWKSVKATRKNCLRLRGLAYEAQVEHIIDFLGNHHVKNIIYQGVHMIYNAQAQPSGEAFIQMDTEENAFLAVQAKHHDYMLNFKEQCCIEVIQCSGDDMKLILNGTGKSRLPSVPSRNGYCGQRWQPPLLECSKHV